MNLFVSYSHQDEEIRQKFGDHLSSLERRDRATIWWDAKINPGQRWQPEIRDHLVRADVILLFISPRFVSFDICWYQERAEARVLHHAGRSVVVPVLMVPTPLWDKTWLSKLPAVHGSRSSPVRSDMIASEFSSIVVPAIHDRISEGSELSLLRQLLSVDIIAIWLRRKLLESLEEVGAKDQNTFPGLGDVDRFGLRSIDASAFTTIHDEYRRFFRVGSKQNVIGRLDPNSGRVTRYQYVAGAIEFDVGKTAR